MLQSSKMDVINGLLIAQAICARRMIDSGGEYPLVAVMGDIVKAIDALQTDTHDVTPS